MAVEIRLRRKYTEHTNGRHRSGYGGNSGVNKHRGETNKDRREAAQAQTRANQRTLVLDGARKRRWAITPR